MDCLYPVGIIAEKGWEVIRGKVVSFFEYIYQKNTTLAYWREGLDRLPSLVPLTVIYFPAAYLLSVPWFLGGIFSFAIG